MPRCVSPSPYVISSSSHALEKLPVLHQQQLWAAQRRQTYLEEIYRLEGRGFANGRGNLTHVCHNDESEGKYRCIDCFDKNLYCLTCTLHQHSRSPLHRIEVTLVVYSDLGPANLQEYRCGRADILSGRLYVLSVL